MQDSMNTQHLQWQKEEIFNWSLADFNTINISKQTTPHFGDVPDSIVMDAKEKL